MNYLTKQKEIALEVLHKLEAVDPACILAGGAPRDWFFNKPAKDLDFYVYIHAYQLCYHKLAFERCGLSLKKLEWKGELPPEYKVMQKLRGVWEGEYKGQKIQVMTMIEPTFKTVVPEFGCSNCMVWWKGKEVKTTLDFLFSVATKTIYKKEDYSAKETHVQKQIEYFPDYRVDSYLNFQKQLDLFCKRNNIYPSSYNIEKKCKELLDIDKNNGCLKQS